jgi:hypothetical protein
VRTTFCLVLFTLLGCSAPRGLRSLEESSAAGEEKSPAITPAPTPVPTLAPIPDYKSDLLSRVGLKLSPRGNSTCQLQPPLIPSFDQASEPGVLKVCREAQCPFQTVSAALAASSEGSVIAIKADTYNECILITKNRITLQGRGGRPLIQSSDCPVENRKAIINVEANDTKIENLEITDPTTDSIVAIGLNVVGANLTLNNLYIHHAQGGLQTVQGEGDVVITNSYFDELGHMEGTDLHTTCAIDVSLKSRSFTISNVTITHPKQQGGMLCSGAYKSNVSCLVAADLDGGLSLYLARFFYGFDVTVSKSVLQRGPLSIPQMLLYWERYPDPMPDLFESTNNIFISDQPTRNLPMLDNFSMTVPATYSNNVFVGPDSTSFSNFPNSFAYESREAAGIGADSLPYPGTSLSPAP